MTRSLAALICFGAALLGAPSRSDAGVIPWMYDSIFGYGHAGYYGGGYGGGYMTGYAPSYPPRYIARMYRASYAAAYSGYGTTVGYAPWYGYSAGGACCSPCGNSCSPCGGGCSPCGTGCDTGCGTGCSGGDCGTSGSTPVQSSPANSNTQGERRPTYAPPTDPSKSPSQDDFTARPNRDRTGPGISGSSVPGSQMGTGSSNADPNNAAPFTPAPGDPGYFKKPDDQSRENGSVVPKLNPINPGDKVAFTTPAKFTRTTVKPTFELPTIVTAPPRTTPEPIATPTAVASK